MSSRGRVAALVAALVAVAAGGATFVVLIESPGGHTARPARATDLRLRVPAIPPPEQLGILVPAPETLGPAGTEYWSAPVLRPVVARAAPAAGPAVATLAPTTPEGTANLVLVLGRRLAAGKLWLRVRLPVLPNGSTGWIPRLAVGGYTVRHTRLVVDLGRLRATLYRDGRPIFGAPVGVGKPSSPTPAGDFYIRDRVTRFRDAFYGPVAFGTSARSAVLTDWPAGGFVGIHGTNRPDLIPGRISHGCIRMRNADIVRLSRLLGAGTALTIRS